MLFRRARIIKIETTTKRIKESFVYVEQMPCFIFMVYMCVCLRQMTSNRTAKKTRKRFMLTQTRKCKRKRKQSHTHIVHSEIYSSPTYQPYIHASNILFSQQIFSGASVENGKKLLQVYTYSHCVYMCMYTECVVLLMVC